MKTVALKDTCREAVFGASRRRILREDHFGAAWVKSVSHAVCRVKV